LSWTSTLQKLDHGLKGPSCLKRGKRTSFIDPVYYDTYEGKERVWPSIPPSFELARPGRGERKTESESERGRDRERGKKWRRSAERNFGGGKLTQPNPRSPGSLHTHPPAIPASWQGRGTNPGPSLIPLSVRKSSVLTTSPVKYIIL